MGHRRLVWTSLSSEGDTQGSALCPLCHFPHSTGAGSISGFIAPFPCPVGQPFSLPQSVLVLSQDMVWAHMRILATNFVCCFFHIYSQSLTLIKPGFLECCRHTYLSLYHCSLSPAILTFFQAVHTHPVHLLDCRLALSKMILR